MARLLISMLLNAHVPVAIACFTARRRHRWISLLLALQFSTAGRFPPCEDRTPARASEVTSSTTLTREE
jgi:hypothetical protein